MKEPTKISNEKNVKNPVSARSTLKANGSSGLQISESDGMIVVDSAEYTVGFKMKIILMAVQFLAMRWHRRSLHSVAQVVRSQRANPLCRTE